MAYNKVVYDGNVLIDLTDLDVTAGDVVSGVTFIMADGTKAVGTITIPTKTSDLVNDSGFITSASLPSVTTPTASVTASTGTLISATAKRYGNIVQLLVTVQNSSSIAQGGNIFAGTLSTTALQPLITATTGSYYSTSAITATLATDGGIVIRNEGASKSFTSNVNVSFTYIVA